MSQPHPASFDPDGPADRGTDVTGARPPVCYRHPDRETYIACQRCGRPICPDDMRPASVGFQCPECVREGSASVRQPRTVLGGPVRRREGLATATLIGLCVLGFGAQYALGDFTSRFELFGGGPSVAGPDPASGVAGGAVWRLLTTGFLHGSPVHLAVNMFSLWVLGRPLEAALGRLRFVGLYLTGLLGSSAVAYLLTPPYQPVVGASGAIFALLGAMFVLGRRLGIDVRSLSGVLIINLAISFLVPNISWQAHLGGLATGALVGAGLLVAGQQRRPLPGLAGYVVALVLAVAVVAYRTTALTG
jgi:membrane associated rhomboid family serine protease